MSFPSIRRPKGSLDSMFKIEAFFSLSYLESSPFRYAPEDACPRPLGRSFLAPLDS